MANEELEKLRQKIDKDPLSKLFVPLAEEYRKIGILDEAISVLLKGLEIHPNYMSARVALGKIYLEKNMPREAKEEFKKVVSVIPDNFFALKKLAEISKDIGHINDAIDAYSKILKFNPLDKDAKTNLELLRQHIHEQLEPPASRPIEIQKPEQKSKELKYVELEGFMPTTQTSYSEEEFERFKNKFMSETTTSPSTPVSEDLYASDLSPSSSEEPGVSPSVTSSPISEEPVSEIIEIGEDAFFIENSEEFTIEEITEPTIPPSLEKPDYEKFMKESIVESKLSPDLELKKGIVDFSYVDKLIHEGNYLKAIEIYKKMLENYPNDKRILQRFEELKFLLKILGKGNKLLIEELNRFLQSIKKRRDEFFRNT